MIGRRIILGSLAIGALYVVITTHNPTSHNTIYIFFCYILTDAVVLFWGFILGARLRTRVFI